VVSKDLQYQILCKSSPQAFAVTPLRSSCFWDVAPRHRVSRCHTSEERKLAWKSIRRFSSCYIQRARPMW